MSLHDFLIGYIGYLIGVTATTLTSILLNYRRHKAETSKKALLIGWFACSRDLAETPRACELPMYRCTPFESTRGTKGCGFAG